MLTAFPNQEGRCGNCSHEQQKISIDENCDTCQGKEQQQSLDISNPDKNELTRTFAGTNFVPHC